MGVGGTVYQRFALPGGLPGGGRRLLEGIDEKPIVGGLGGLTEKDIEEKASFFVSIWNRPGCQVVFKSLLLLTSIST